MTTIVYLKGRVLVRDKLTLQTHDEYCIPQRSCFSTRQTNSPHTTTIVYLKCRVLVRDKLTVQHTTTIVYLKCRVLIRDKLTVHTRRLLYTSKVVF